jgi:hypothetical protein
VAMVLLCVQILGCVWLVRCLFNSHTASEPGGTQLETRGPVRASSTVEVYVF